MVNTPDRKARQQAAPENVSTQCFAHRVCSVRRIQRSIELPHLETFPGAACYQPIELPPGKAAPLQGGGLTISPYFLRRTIWARAINTLKIIAERYIEKEEPPRS